MLSLLIQILREDETQRFFICTDLQNISNPWSLEQHWFQQMQTGFTHFIHTKALCPYTTTTVYSVIAHSRAPFRPCLVLHRLFLFNMSWLYTIKKAVVSCIYDMQKFKLWLWFFFFLLFVLSHNTQQVSVQSHILLLFLPWIFDSWFCYLYRKIK